MRIRLMGRRLAAAVSSQLAQKLVEVADGCLRHAARRFPDGLEPSADVTFVGERRIRALNAEWRGKDRVTDVLSFPLLEYRQGEVRLEPGDVDPDTSELPLGDIFICTLRARDQARRYGHSIEREMAFLTAHGLLHLLGFDHETDSEAAEMFALQNLVLQEAGLPREAESGS